MSTKPEIEKRIIDLQKHYQYTLLGSKEFSELKSIKNNLRKLYQQLQVELREREG